MLATLTVTGAESVVLPAASRARAVSVCAPFGTVARVPRKRVRARRVLGSGVDAVDEELHAGDADVVGRVGGDVDDVVHLRVGRGRGDRDRRRRRVGRRRRPSGVRHVGLDLGGVSARL